MKYFRKILIANRGEIALRVMRTCRAMGIASVAVYSDADTDSPHVRYGDEAVRVGPPPTGESYLRIDRHIEAAKRTGATATMPNTNVRTTIPRMPIVIRIPFSRLPA